MDDQKELPQLMLSLFTLFDPEEMTELLVDLACRLADTVKDSSGTKSVEAWVELGNYETVDSSIAHVIYDIVRNELRDMVDMGCLLPSKIEKFDE